MGKPFSTRPQLLEAETTLLVSSTEPVQLYVRSTAGQRNANTKPPPFLYRRIREILTTFQNRESLVEPESVRL